MDVQTRHDISRTIEDRGWVTLLLSANRKSYNAASNGTTTLSDLE